MSRLLVATTNRGKLAELAPVLAAQGWEPVGLHDVPAVPAPREDAPDFAGNARRKALHYARATGLPALADDSGLEVAALDGAPGVRSARFAGPAADDAANRALLLARLAGVADRRARFVCALCLVRDGAPVLEVVGECRGTITEAPRGTGGFGYDALFVPAHPGAGGRTFAELARAEKAAFGHRGAALAALAAGLDAADAAARVSAREPAAGPTPAAGAGPAPGAASAPGRRSEAP